MWSCIFWLLAKQKRIEHLENLEQVFECLLEHGLQLKKEKCQLIQPSVAYLGYVVDAERLNLMPEKVDAIMKALRSWNVKELRSFLGLVGYYRRFITNMSTLTKPFWNKDASGNGHHPVKLLSRS